MTPSSVRDELMAKLKGLGHNGATEQISADLRNLGRAPTPTLPSNDLCEAFFINVLKNQGSVNCAANRSEAVKAVADYLHERFRNRKLVAGNDPRLAALPWRDGGLLPRFGAAESGENASLSYAELGVAETGSIITFTGKNNPSANNLLVEDHLVLLDVVDLVAKLEDAWDIINADALERGRPRGVNIISGPSSTADIDAQLVKGAHGPRAWHVILMGDVPDTALPNARNYIDGHLNNL